MEIRERSEGAVTVLDLRGRLVLGAPGEQWGNGMLRTRIGALARGDRPDVIVNLAGVSQVDTSGLTELVTAYQAVVQRGGHLKLVNPSDRLRYLLRVTGLNSLFEVFDSENEAVESAER